MGDTSFRAKKTKMNKQTTLKSKFAVSVEIGSSLKNLLVFENCISVLHISVLQDVGLINTPFSKDRSSHCTSVLSKNC